MESSPKIHALSLGFAFEYKMHTQGIITPHMPFKALTRSIRHKDPQEARKTKGIEENTWQEMSQIIAKANVRRIKNILQQI